MPLGAECVHVGQPVDARQVAGHLAEGVHHRRAIHQRSAVTALNFGCDQSAGNFFRVHHSHQQSAEPRDFVDRSPRSRRRLEALAECHETFFVVEAFERTNEAERRVRAASPQVDFAPERGRHCHGPVAANLSQHCEVNRRLPETVDRRFDHVLCLETVAGNRERGRMTRRVATPYDAFVIQRFLRTVTVQQVLEFIVWDDRRLRIRHRHQSRGIRLGVAFEAPTNFVVRRFRADSLKDFRVREIAKDIRGEAEPHLETVPEATTRFHGLAVHEQVIGMVRGNRFVGGIVADGNLQVAQLADAVVECRRHDRLS